MPEYIYIVELDSRNEKVVKIGSSRNLSARFKCYKTSNLNPINVLYYYDIGNFNCYKLDNIIKIQFKHYRVQKQGGGTEFYKHFEIEILMKNLNIYLIVCN
jgi:hypothetical protein